MLGSELGSYKLVSLLGAGGMGEVYVGEHQLLKRRVAVKVLLEDFSADQQVVARFINEARATSALAHPGIVRVFDFGTTPAGRAYMLMEFLEGQTLASRLEERGYLEVPQALAIGRQLAEALGVAHANGVVHRDLKPDNVFLVADPAAPLGERAKILDFGIAKMLNPTADTPKTRTGSILGTPVYMSPEQCTGASGIDHRADVYSLGCVLFHLLCGRPPFDLDGVGELLGAHLYTPAPAPRSIHPALPEGIDTVMARLLAKQPRDRYGSMSEVIDALDAVARDAHIESAPSTVKIPPPAVRISSPAIADKTIVEPSGMGATRIAEGPRPVAAQATLLVPPPEPPEAPEPVSDLYSTLVPRSERPRMSVGLMTGLAFGLTAVLATLAFLLLRR